MKNEIKMWLAEKFLNWAFDMTPWNNEGQKLRKYVSLYYIDKIQENE